MQNKNILYILVAAILFINFYSDLSKSNKKEIKKLHLIEAKTQKEEWVARHIKNVKEAIKEYKDLIKKDEKYFFSKKENDSSAMNKFQQSLKSVVALSKVKEITIKWGEPYKKAGGYFTALPMNVVIDTKPENVIKFFKNLSLEPYLVKIDSLSVSIMDNKIRFFINLIAYKLNKIKEKKNG